MTQPASPPSDADNGTVNRVLRILARFAEKDRWGLNELSRSLNLPRGTTPVMSVGKSGAEMPPLVPSGRPWKLIDITGVSGKYVNAFAAVAT